MTELTTAAVNHAPAITAASSVLVTPRTSKGVQDNINPIPARLNSSGTSDGLAPPWGGISHGASRMGSKPHRHCIKPILTVA